MKCKNKRCALESMHKGRCSEQGPYAINTVATNRESGATNRPGRLERISPVHAKQAGGESECVAREEGSSGVAVGVADAGGDRTKNRRDRKAYNEYQRAYMKAKRRLKKAGFIGIAYG